MAGPKQLSHQKVSAHNINSSLAALHVVQLDSTGGIVSGGAGGGSTQVSVKDILTPNGDSVMDDVNNAIQVNVVAGAAAGSTLVTVRQSTYTDFNTLSRIADRDQSTQVAGVLNATPASTVWALAVREVAQSTGPFAVSSVAGRSLVEQNSTVWQVQVSQTVRVSQGQNNSSGGDAWPTATIDSSNAIVKPGDSANNAIRVNVVAGAAGGSTIVTVSTGAVTISGIVDSSNALVKPGDSANSAIRVNVVAGAAGGSTIVTVSTGSVRVHQSTAADLNVTVAGYVAPSTTIAVSTVQGRVFVDQNSTVWQTQTKLQDSSGVNVGGSTGPVPVGANALNVRLGMPDIQSTGVVITSSNSTALYSLVSSAAALRHKCFAYSLTSTETTPSTLVFFSSNARDVWRVAFGSGSSGVIGANLAVSPPAWMFGSNASEALRCLIEKAASTQCIVTLSIAYFSEA